MRVKSLPYKEGSLFLLPLRDGRQALGVVARMDGKGTILAYFFVCDGEDVQEGRATLSAERADLIAQVGDLGLLNGSWYVVGIIDGWSRAAWPLPEFHRIVDGNVIVSRYDDQLRFVAERPGLQYETKELPRDVLMGYGAAEIWLTALRNNEC
ncbi:Imm26 family immunity protein [Coralloluteibacterium thermophilus]|uniref:Imm26 family immunity protein n=1 Tax=Coralloluteibacterium thermophilum TaxID=2707049 RepID=A0ABV9NIR4_9GAMM